MSSSSISSTTSLLEEADEAIFKLIGGKNACIVSVENCLFASSNSCLVVVVGLAVAVVVVTGGTDVVQAVLSASPLLNAYVQFLLNS